MTNEVIIDGVNVAECKNFSCGICEEENKIPRTIGHFIADCTFYPNCYFKQLQRAKVELEQYKKSKQASYEAMQKEWNAAINEYRKIIIENEKLKKEIDNLRRVD